MVLGASDKLSADWISAIATVVAAVVAMVATFFAYKAARAAADSVEATKKAISAESFVRLIDEYRSAATGDALLRLGEFMNEERIRLFRMRAQHAPWDASYTTDQADRDRRLVHWFYKSAHIQFRAGILSKKEMKELTALNAYPLFCSTIIEMSRPWPSNGQAEPPLPEWFRELQKAFPPGAVSLHTRDV